MAASTKLWPSQTKSSRTGSISETNLKSESYQLPRSAINETKEGPVTCYPCDKSGLFVTWWLEIFAAVFSLSCVTVNAAVLSAIDGRPYRTFHMKSIDITPNTFISIVSTFSKSSLLLAVSEGVGQLKWVFFQRHPHYLVDLQTFDNASRGPLGSLVLLWRIRCKATGASVGALLVILALAIEPLTQQVLSYPSLITNAINETATIGATQYFYPVFVFGGPIDSIGYAMARTVLGTPIDPPYNCSSGSCTWPTFETIGLCTTCQDLSNSTSVVCDESIGLCKYGIPGASPTWTMWNSMRLPLNISQYISSTFMNMSYSYSSIGQRGELGTVTSVIFQPIASNGTFKIDQARPSVHRCKASICIKSYSSSCVTNGVVKDEPTSTTPVEIDFASWKFVDNAAAYPVYKQGTLAFTAGQAEHGHGRRPNATHNGIYWMVKPDANFLNKGLAAIFNLETMSSDTSAFSPEILAKIPITYRQALEAQANLGSANAANPLIGAFASRNGGNVSATIESIGTTVTNVLRGSIHSISVHGEAMRPIMYVQVNWPWMIYPAIVSILASIFLLACILISNEKSGLVWKTSSLPLLFYGLRGWKAREADQRSLRDMRNKSKSMMAQLIEDEVGDIALQKC